MYKMYKTKYDRSLDFEGHAFITYKIKVVLECYNRSDRKKIKTVVHTVTSDSIDFALCEAGQLALDEAFEKYFDAEIIDAEILDYWRV